jgi:hypothetical protein
MIIQINARYRITSDETQWTVEQSYQAKTKDSEERITAWKNVGYYSSLSGAVNALYQRGIRSSQATTLSDAIKDAQGLLQTITKALEPEVKAVKVI